MTTTIPVDEATIRQAIDELNIGVPVRACAVENGHLILYLAYGGKATWIPPELRPDPTTGRPSPSAPAIPPDLDALLKRDLRQLARLHAVPDWNVLRKAELIAALAERRDNQERRRLAGPDRGLPARPGSDNLPFTTRLPDHATT